MNLQVITRPRLHIYKILHYIGIVNDNKQLNVSFGAAKIRQIFQDGNTGYTECLHNKSIDSSKRGRVLSKNLYTSSRKASSYFLFFCSLIFL